MSNERAIEKGLEFAIDRAEGLLVKLERIDSTRAEDIESKSDVLDFIEDGGKAGRTTDEILDHFAPRTTNGDIYLPIGGSRGNTTKK